MTLLDKVKDFLEALEDFPVMVEQHSCIWTKNDYEVSYNIEDNLDHLSELVGETYNGEICGGIFEKDGCVFINVDNGCGDTLTMIFLKDKYVELE